MDSNLRNFFLNEPRGGVFKHCNIIVKQSDPKADAGFIIMATSCHAMRIILSGDARTLNACTGLQAALLPFAVRFHRPWRAN